MTKRMCDMSDSEFEAMAREMGKPLTERADFSKMPNWQPKQYENGDIIKMPLDCKVKDDEEYMSESRDIAKWLANNKQKSYAPNGKTPVCELQKPYMCKTYICELGIMVDGKLYTDKPIVEPKTSFADWIERENKINLYVDDHPGTSECHDRFPGAYWYDKTVDVRPNPDLSTKWISRSVSADIVGKKPQGFITRIKAWFAGRIAAYTNRS